MSLALRGRGEFGAVNHALVDRVQVLNFRGQQKGANSEHKAPQAGNAWWSRLEGVAGVALLQIARDMARYSVTCYAVVWKV